MPSMRGRDFQGSRLIPPIEADVFGFHLLLFVLRLRHRRASSDWSLYAVEIVGRQIKPGPNGFGKPLSVHLLQALHVARES